MKLVRNLETVSKTEKKMQYMLNMRPLTNEQAMFADATEAYRSPCQPNHNEYVTFRFRTARYNVDSVKLYFGGTAFNMEVERSTYMFDYYSVKVYVGTERTEYYYKVTNGRTVVYYNMVGSARELNPNYNFVIYPGFKVPEWAKGAVMYQIYVDRFYNGDESNDVVDNEYIYIGEPVNKVKDWDKYPATMGVREFYGGDLQGVMDKLPYLKELGIDVIYFNPLFVSPSNHKYDIQDYDYIDPHFGKIVKDGGEPVNKSKGESNANATKYIERVAEYANLEASNEFFAEFVAKAHEMGIRVIIDGVFNHCGSFNKWLDRERIYENREGFEKGAYISADSPYRDFFHFAKQDAWPYNNTYEGWWGHDTLPKLNYEESQKLEEYILGIAKKWVSPPYNVDGWRLDVAADLGRSNEYNHRFWRKFRKAVKSANPDAIILAEHYGDPNDWLHGDQWDTVMNYDAFMEPVTYFLTGMEKHSDSDKPELIGDSNYFLAHMRHNMARLGSQPMSVAMNELSNHDHSRFLTRTNRKIGRTATMGPEKAEQGVNRATMMVAVTIQMTWPGAPTIYYGDEAGVCGWTDPDCRRTYPWGNEDKVLLEFHKEIIKIHKSNQALMDGSLKPLCGELDVLAYGRFAGDNKVVVVLNNSDRAKSVDVPVWLAEIPDTEKMKRLILTDGDFDNVPEYINVVAGVMNVKLPAYSSAVYVAVNEEN